MIEGIVYDENVKKWKRDCPKCKKSIFHKNKYLCNLSNKRKIICKSCAFTKYTNIPASLIYNELEKKWYKTCPKCKTKIKQQSKSFAMLTLNCVCKNCVDYSRTLEQNKNVSDCAKKRWATSSFREKMTPHFKNIRYTNTNKKNLISSYKAFISESKSGA